MSSREGSFSIESLHTALHKLDQAVLQDERQTGLRLIRKILENIVNHPEDPKFLSVNRLSTSYRKKILLDGAPEGELMEAVLFSCGFAVYAADNRSPRGSFAGSQDTLQLLPCVRSEDVAACLTLVVQKLHGASCDRPVTTASSEAAASASSTSESLRASRRLPPVESPADMQLRAIREAHARRFENHARGAREPDALSGDATARGSGNAPQRGASGGRVSSFFTSLFRPASGRRGNGRTTSTTQGNSSSRMMTLRDLPPPIRRGG